MILSMWTGSWIADKIISGYLNNCNAFGCSGGVICNENHIKFITHQKLNSAKCCPILDTLVSGSPIIQDGKLVGAVTNVLVNDPTTGYGIFIENMLDAAT